MGKRKAAKKQQGPKKAEPLPTVFPCLFCNHEKSITVKIDKKSGVGQLNCKVCNQQFQCAVNYLSAAVDVYSDWVDACDAVAKDNTEDRAGGASKKATAGRGARTGDGDDDEEDLADLIDDADADDDDGTKGYGGEGIVADDEY